MRFISINVFFKKSKTFYQLLRTHDLFRRSANDVIIHTFSASLKHVLKRCCDFFNNIIFMCYSFYVFRDRKNTSTKHFIGLKIAGKGVHKSSIWTNDFKDFFGKGASFTDLKRSCVKRKSIRSAFLKLGRFFARPIQKEL